MIIISSPTQFGTINISVDGERVLSIRPHGERAPQFALWTERFRSGPRFYDTEAEAIGAAMDQIARKIV